MRVTLKNNQTGEEAQHYTPAQMEDDANFVDKETVLSSRQPIRPSW